MNNDPVVKALFNQTTTTTYERGELISTFGGTEETIYLVDSGYVKYISQVERSREHTLFFYGPGEIFPWRFIFKDPSTHTRYYKSTAFVALTDAAVLTASRAAFVQAMKTDPVLTFNLFNQQNRLYGRSLFALHVNTSQQRIIYRLLVLADQFGRTEDGHVIIDFPLTQQEFADTIQLSRETTGKLLNDLEAEGYIIWGRKNILVYTTKLAGLLKS